MIVDLSNEEQLAVKEIAKDTDLSETAVIRQALRVYQLVRHRQSQGHTMAWLDSKGDIIESDMQCGCAADD